MKNTFEIENLKNRITNYSSVQCDYYSEACIVLLKKMLHQSGVSMRVNEENGNFLDNYELVWLKETIDKGWRAKNKLIENAATAIAFFLVSKHTDYTVIEESEILNEDNSTGIDYWLSYDENHELYNEDNFLNARLEISGIMQANKGNTINSRLKRKIKQAKASASTGFPVHIAIAEFKTPVAILTNTIGPNNEER